MIEKKYIFECSLNEINKGCLRYIIIISKCAFSQIAIQELIPARESHRVIGVTDKMCHDFLLNKSLCPVSLLVYQLPKKLSELVTSLFFLSSFLWSVSFDNCRGRVLLITDWPADWLRRTLQSLLRNRKLTANIWLISSRATCGELQQILIEWPVNLRLTQQAACELYEYPISPLTWRETLLIRSFFEDSLPICTQAKLLGSSYKTLSARKRTVMRKFGCHSLPGLMNWEIN